MGHLLSFCYVALLVRGSLASAAQVGLAEASHFEQFSDMMKVRHQGIMFIIAVPVCEQWKRLEPCHDFGQPCVMLRVSG